MNNTTRPTASRNALASAFGMLLAAAAGSAFATEYGSVVSSTPVMGDVAVPQRQCFDEEQAVAAPRTYASSGAGALIGAVVGGVVGNSVGAGMGRAAATGIGAVAGAAIGDRVEANGTPQAAPETAIHTVRRCRTVSRHEQRVIGYDVVYDYAGKRYSTRLAQEPGERIPLDVRVTPVGAVPPARAAAPRYYDDEGASLPPPVIYATAPPAYVAAPPVVWGGPAVYVAPTIWFGGSWGHRHWR
jgi:uncharacterized protein YcfJ